MNGSSENAAITKVSEILLEDLISDKSFETMPSISMLDRLKRSTLSCLFLNRLISALETSPPPIKAIDLEPLISESTTDAIEIGFSESFVSVLTCFESFIAPLKMLSISLLRQEIM